MAKTPVTEVYNETNFNLSLRDLMLVDGFKEAWYSENEKVVKEILWANGMNVREYPYEMNYCTHRTLIGAVYEGIRFEGFERTDRAWLATGAASIEAHIRSCNDANLRHTLRTMRPSGTTDLKFRED